MPCDTTTRSKRDYRTAWEYLRSFRQWDSSSLGTAASSCRRSDQDRPCASPARRPPWSERSPCTNPLADKRRPRSLHQLRQPCPTTADSIRRPGGVRLLQAKPLPWTGRKRNRKREAEWRKEGQDGQSLGSSF